MLRMGYFPNFKGADSALLAADSEGIRFLLGAIARVTANPAQAIPLHESAQVSAEHPASVYVAINPKAIRRVPANTYYLDVTGNARLNVEGLLEPLAEASAGHQYFDLYPRHVLVVSVGEYDSFWWDRAETL
jgi:hypothetical protein